MLLGPSFHAPSKMGMRLAWDDPADRMGRGCRNNRSTMPIRTRLLADSSGNRCPIGFGRIRIRLQSGVYPMVQMPPPPPEHWRLRPKYQLLGFAGSIPCSSKWTDVVVPFDDLHFWWVLFGSLHPILTFVLIDPIDEPHCHRTVAGMGAGFEFVIDGLQPYSVLYGHTLAYRLGLKD